MSHWPSSPRMFRSQVLELIDILILIRICFQRGKLHINYILGTLHRFISASIRRWMTYDPAELPILPGGKCCALALLNIIPKFPKEKHQFLSDLSSKSGISMCSTCMIDSKCFFENFVNQKNGVHVCDESPPKRRTVAETFAWRLILSSVFGPLSLEVAWALFDFSTQTT